MPSSPAVFRRLAVSLPDAYEGAHMGHPDFRIATADGKGRIFATLSPQEKGFGMVKLTPEQQQEFQSELPEVFEPVPGGWGRMGCTWVHLEGIEEDTLLGALRTAHRNAVKKLQSVKPKTGSAKPKPSAVKSRPAAAQGTRNAKPRIKK